RDDKSPFFEELEAAILKDEISKENVERAYHEYLSKLDEVARLEVRGSVREVEPEGETDPDAMSVDRLHVVARTCAMPHKYFHRVREPGREGGVWGPWRPIDVEIEGDHLLPVVWDRRLYLFWPVFTAKEEAPELMNVPGLEDPNFKPNASTKFLEVQIAWTRLHEGKWSPKGLSTQFARFGDKDNPRTKADADRIVLMDYREKGAEPYLVLRELSPKGYVDEMSRPISWFRVRAEAGVFDLQASSELPSMNSYFTGVPEMAQLGRRNRSPRPKLSLAMSSLSEKGNKLALPAQQNRWDNNADVLRGAPSPYSVTPLYPRSRPQRQATFPTLFYADNRRSFVIDPVERFWWETGQKLSPTKPALGADEPSVNFDKSFIDDLRFYVPDLLDDLQVAPEPLPPLPWEGIVLPGQGVVEAGSLLLGSYIPQTRMALTRVNDSQTVRALATVTPTEAAPLGANLAVAAPVGLSVALDASKWIVDAIRGTWKFQRTWRFRTNHHPWVRLFVKHLNAYGINGLLDPRPDTNALDNEERRFLRRQGVHTNNKLGSWDFKDKENKLGYDPTALVVATDGEGNNVYPQDDIDFSEGGTYSLYNWELFFHAPLLVAVHLSRHQRFEEARTWFHTIFDPTDTAEADEQTPQRFWKVKPLYETYWAEDESAQKIDRLLHLFSEDTSAAAKTAIYEDVAAQIRYWLDNPFSPWAIARLRWSAYQRTVVLRYVDNLIQWGDSYFRQYTLESVDQARLLYVLASELLGQRPEEVEIREPEPQSFQDLYNSGQLDLFSNALVEITAELDPTPSTAWDDLPPVLSPSLYFCIPRDEKLLAYWDRVEDRLYKIRHCLDIDGVARQLALFDPPIDPGGLVRAVAGGASIASALAALNAPIPAFRYSVMVARAKELCGEVRVFGAALLAALEKKDGEALAQLRSSHELGLLDAVAEVRKLQVEEANKGIEVIVASKEIAATRQAHFQALLNNGWSALETGQMASMVTAGTLRTLAGGIEALAAGLALIPQIDLGAEGFGGSPRVTTQFGGQQISAAIKFASDVMNLAAVTADSVAATTGLAASHERREQDWVFQRNLARKEVDSIDLQIEAADLRLQIAEREQNNHALQRDNAAEADAFLRSKFTGVDLYDWMVGQLASVYVQAYQLALDLARRAERAWQFEVAAATPPTFVKASHWDSLRKGLLAGERLAMDLHRMEVAYLEQSRREYELTRNVSLSQVDPLALLTLKSTGTCELTLPEMLFDMDRPGLYHRRIKAVTLSLPCVTGPHTPVHAT
ncbi:MAG: neuraminidase-like domain-containing protein, partial [Candidatus Nanopelagicales bacterium]